MKNKTQHYNIPNRTRLKLIERLNRQEQKLNRLVNIYNTYESNYYGRSKRKNIIHNSLNTIQSFKGDVYNMSAISNKELSLLIKQNSQLLRTYGSTYNYSNDVLAGFMIVQLNNEAYYAVNWSDSDPTNDLYELEEMKQDVYADMLLNELVQVSPNLGERTLRKILEKSVLEEEYKEWIIENYLDIMSNLSLRRK